MPDTAGYMTGFGNEFATEAVSGALPVGQNSPQKPPLGLYAESLSGTAFTVPRAQNRRSWLYRIRPSAAHPPYRRIDGGLIRSGPFEEAEATPNRLRWSPPPIPDAPADFVEGLVTMGGCGSPAEGWGVGIHYYLANRSMVDRVFFDADGELLITPQQGALVLGDRDGRLARRAARDRRDPARRALPRRAAGRTGARLCLRELRRAASPARARAHRRQRPRKRPRFPDPVAAFEDEDRPTQVVQKFQGALWSMTLDHSPLDVVAWHGNYAPCKYDLRRFNTMGAVSYDHPDPSIFTVLTSPSDTPGVANADFVIFPPRWQVAEHTFRPPWFHRNVMNEFMGLISGAYDAKAEGFLPGGASCTTACPPTVRTRRPGPRPARRCWCRTTPARAWPSWSRPAA